MVSLRSRISPLTLTVIFFDRSPRGDRGRHFGDVPDLPGQVAGHEVDAVGEVLPRAGDAGHAGLAAELAFGADLARDARHFAREPVELVHHRVDGVLQLENLAADVDRDLAREVAARDGRRHLRDAADLTGQVAAHRVDRVGQVLPRAGDAGHDRLAAELAVGADLARDARHFRRERPQLVDHRVDGFLQLQDLAADVDRDLLGQVAVGDRDRDVGDVAHLRGQVAGHQVDAVRQVLPDAADVLHLRLPAELAVGADLARDARDLGREHAELPDHRVDDRRGAQELALERPPVDVEPDGLQQVALRHRGQRPRHLRRRPQQIVDERVDRRLHLAPRSGGAIELHALPGLALPADHGPDPVQLARDPRVGRGDLVEGVGDLAVEAGPVAREPDREVTVPHRLKGPKQRRRRVRRTLQRRCGGGSGRFHAGSLDTARAVLFGRTEHIRYPRRRRLIGRD